jgi:hypothetical protein
MINSAMEIDQRNAGSSVTLNNAGAFTVDRWQAAAVGGSGTGTATAQRVVDAPSGFTYSLKYTVTNAKTPSSGDQFYIYQPLEGQNITDFAYGTASAKTVALSFQVKSSLTGTFSARLRSYNGSTSRSYVFNYTINSANTWQYVTITAPGDAGQVPSTDNTLGYDVLFDLGSGSTYQTSTLNAWQTGNYYRSTTSTNLIATNGATFYLTGVQLEIGTTATPFERRSYGAELSLCQRYCQKFAVFPNSGFASFISYYGGTNALSPVQRLTTPMRITPTASFVNGSVEYYSFGGSWTSTTLAVSIYSSEVYYIYCASDADGRGKLLRNGGSGLNPDPVVTFVAEL